MCLQMGPTNTRHTWGPMKKTSRTQKLALRRDIIRQLTDRDLGRAQGGNRDDDEPDCGHGRGGGCGNPVYSAILTED